MIIAITGLVGSGKTTAALFIKENYKDINLIEADKIGHPLLNKKPIKDKLIKAFGNKILNKNNKIDRKRLAELVFKDKNKLNQLNQIVHPFLIEEIKKRIKNNKINVIDAALFYELNLKNICDKIILIKINKFLILKRNKKNQDIKNILKSQRLIKEYDYLIDNKGGIAQLHQGIRQLFDEILK